MNKEVSYKIYRRRQNQEWWTDITGQYSCTGYFYESEKEEAIQWAKLYKEQHKSDFVKVEEITTSAIVEL